MEDFFLLFQQSGFYVKAWHLIRTSWPVWLPLLFLGVLFNSWFSYKRREWMHNQGNVLLEIKLPKNIEKSPAAMEMVLEGIWEPVIGSLTDALLGGRVRDWFSLEIVSLGGEIKFYIWALPKWKNTIESRIYNHYPGAEIFEVKDYALDVSYDPEKMNIAGINTRLVKPDAYPIKTYIDYELGKGSKEQEEIVDPITPILEYFGSLKPGEQAWMQIMIQAHRKQGFQDAYFFSRPDWKAGIKKEIQKMVEDEAIIKPEEGKHASFFNLSPTQAETIKAIERNAGKLAFDTMIRIVYTAPLEVYDRTRLGGIIGSMRQFGSGNLNGIRPNTFYPGITYPWEDFLDIRKKAKQKALLDSYKRRSFFNVPYKHLHGKPYVLTVEELATIYHFPGATATTPTLVRVPSKKAEAPANLPV